MASTTAKPADIDPVLAAVDRAPTGDSFPPEIRAELDRTMAAVAAGRVQLVAHDDVPAWLEEQARRAQAG